MILFLPPKHIQQKSAYMEGERGRERERERERKKEREGERGITKEFYKFSNLYTHRIRTGNSSITDE